MKTTDLGKSTLDDVPWIRGPIDRPTTLLWSARLRHELCELAERDHPDEACGLLLGRNFPSGAVVMRVEPATNLQRDRRHDRFELSPEDFLRIDRAARDDELEIVGIWHSHPNHPARPSRTDHENAWDGYAYVIVSTTATGALDVRSWRLAEGAFREEALVEQPS